MTKSDDDSKGGDDQAPDRKVGYRNPPRERRYPKGTSGNPKGRPPGSRNKPREGTIVRKILKIANRTGNGTTSLLEANFLKLGIEGAGGNVYAAKSFAWIAKSAEESQLQRREDQLRTIVRTCRA